ncbi:DEAD/DEAH box helicase family protein [bacterium]|nr:DEAD/DEAH box helicase family protein [bacterium]
MELREHQVAARSMIANSIRRGNKRIMLGASCSFGKTVLAADMMRSAVEKGKRAFFICDRIQLVEQALASFDKNIGGQIGVIQSNHNRSNPDAPIQVASVQTLMRKPRLPAADFIMIDEAHILYKWVIELMETYNNVPIIGLSATPYTKSLGKHYQDLVVPITPQELIAKGYLTPIRYFVGREPDTKGLRSVRRSWGLDFSDELEERVIDNDLMGDIVKNWQAHGQGRITACFAQSIKHSKAIVDKFKEAGIFAVHIDCYTPPEIRQNLIEQHANGDFLILSCANLLSTGWDSPNCSCLIDASPTKSLIKYVQNGGRIQRIAEGKTDAIYLDHAGNWFRHGCVEDIVPDHLHTGKKEDERDLTTKEKKEKKDVKCPQCGRVHNTNPCPQCGYMIQPREDPCVIEMELQEIKSKAERQNQVDWYAGLIYHAKSKKYSDGWAAHVFKEKFGEWPSGLDRSHAVEPTTEVKNYLQYRNIKRAKSKQARIH